MSDAQAIIEFYAKRGKRPEEISELDVCAYRANVGPGDPAASNPARTPTLWERLRRWFA